jgi:Cd2+/Zn2+-exporting ATPase
MGKLFFALGGGLLTLNSFILEYLLPSQVYAVQLSALCGAVVLRKKED